MTDDTHPIPAPMPERARVDGPAPRRFDTLPILYLVGFVVLASALAYLWRHPAGSVVPPQDGNRVETLQQQVHTLAGRVAQLEQRPTAVPPAPDLAPFDARITELEKRPSVTVPANGAPPAPATVNLAPLEARLTELEHRPPPAPPADLGPLTAGLAALTAKQVSDAGTLNGKLDSLDGRIRSSATAITGRLDALEARAGAVEQQVKQTAGQLGAIADHAQRLSRIQAASAALESGQRLGDIPGAPPAVTRFAHNAPPTDAALRLSFNQAAEAAQRASQPAIMDDKPFATRLWTRAQQSVTVRQGDRVLLGDPVSGVLAHARQALEAGDLAGAVNTLDGLAGPAAAAMQGWTGQARALLEARAALAGMAAQN